MAISVELLLETIDDIASIEYLSMDPKDLAQDVFLLSTLYSDEVDFTSAITQTKKAVLTLAAGRALPSALAKDYTGWLSYHYQPKAVQGMQACMRLVHQQHLPVIDCLGFGHRWSQGDIYKRLRSRLDARNDKI